MSIRVLNVSDGDYKVKVQNTGSITLQTGDFDPITGTVSNSGRVDIYGDLWVYGSQTQVESTNLYIKDQIITLADGNTNATLPGGLGGILIQRASGNAQILFNESLQHRNSAFSLVNGSFELTLGNDRAGLFVSSIQVAPDEDLYLINQGDGVITVEGTNNYEENILDYPIGHTPGGPYSAFIGQIVLGSSNRLKDALVNTQGLADYVTSALYYANITHITNDDTEVKVYDSASLDPASSATPSYINFKVDNTQRAKIDSNNLSIPITYSGTVGDHYLRISGDGTNAVLSVTGGNRNIEFDPSGTGKVKVSSDLETTGVVQIGNQVSAPSTNSNYNVLYSKSTLGMGKTGLYFSNPTTGDELVSRRRALGFSMIF